MSRNHRLLLRTKLSDLSLEQKPFIVPIVCRRVRQELDRLGLSQVPLNTYAGLSWQVAEGSVAICVPFYLYSRQLLGVHKSMVDHGVIADKMSDYTYSSVLRHVRHELGHVFDIMYGISKRSDFCAIFGSARKKYDPNRFGEPSAHDPSHYVANLGEGYAAVHPWEDFAETFAVVVSTERDWTRLVGGPGRGLARKKCEYVAALIEASRRQELRKQRLWPGPRVDAIKRKKITLADLYLTHKGFRSEFC